MRQGRGAWLARSLGGAVFSFSNWASFQYCLFGLRVGIFFFMAFLALISSGSFVSSGI